MDFSFLVDDSTLKVIGNQYTGKLICSLIHSYINLEEWLSREWKEN